MTQNGVTYLLTDRQTQPFIVKDIFMNELELMLSWNHIPDEDYCCI